MALDTVNDLITPGAIINFSCLLFVVVVVCCIRGVSQSGFFITFP